MYTDNVAFIYKFRRPYLLTIITICVMLCICSNAQAEERCKTVFNGDRSEPQIAITVDDCYNADHVRTMVDLCKKYDIPITFFVVGSALKIEDQPLWQEAIDAGCEIGNHTWNHPNLAELNSSNIQFQLDRTEEKLDEVLGYSYPMQVMRPPYGTLSTNPDRISDSWVRDAIGAAGYPYAVRWDVDETDADRALRKTKNGSILIYHANRKDVRCLEKLIPKLIKKGFECVTVSEILSSEGANTSGDDESVTIAISDI